MMKNPTPPPPSVVICDPAEKVRSVNVRESVSRCLSSRPWKSGTRLRSSMGADMRAILKHAGQPFGERAQLIEVRLVELRAGAVPPQVEAADDDAVAKDRKDQQRLRPRWIGEDDAARVEMGVVDDHRR